MTAKQAVKLASKGQPNFMTPNPYAFGWVKPGEIAFELSKGRGFLDSPPIHGVTFVLVTGPESAQLEHTHSECFSCKHHARKHVEKFQRYFERAS